MITGHLVHLAVRALGALRTASPPHHHLHPRWVFLAFMVAVVLLLAERAVHHDLTLLGVLSNGAIWGRYYEYLVARHSSHQTITNNRATLLDFWKFLEVATPKVTGPDGAKHERWWYQARPKDLEKYLERRGHPGRAHAGEPLSRSTQAIYQARVIKLYRWASAKRLLPGRNPFEDVVPMKRGARRPRALPLPEVTDLLHALADQQRLYIMACLGYYQGLRVGEICRLSIEDIDWGSRPPSIRIDGKGGREAELDLSPALMPILRSYLITRPSSGPLLPNHTHPNQHLNPTYASHLLADAMRPLVGDTAHALRHTCASELRAAGVDLLGLMSVLRHTSASSTQVYLDNRPGLVAGYLNKLPDPLADPLASPT